MNGTLVVSGETTIGLLNTSTIINGGTISAMTYSIGGQGVISGSRQFTGTDLELKNNNGDSKLIITGETGIAQIDTINEITANAGVTIESVELKDNTITAHTIEATNYSVGSVNFVSATRQGNFRDLEVKSGSNVVTVLIDGDTGNTTIDGRLDTTDASFSKISTTGTADFNGLSTFNNGLTVTSGSVIVDGDVSLNDRLFVSNDVSFNKNLYVKENLIVDGNVSLKQYNNEYIVNTHTTNYDLIAAEDLSVNGNLFINNDTSLNGDLYVAGSIAGTLTTPAQSNITSVGTLSSLALSGHITPSTHGTINMGTNSLKFNEIHGVNIQSNTITVNNDISFAPNVGVVHQF